MSGCAKSQDGAPEMKDGTPPPPATDGDAETDAADGGGSGDDDDVSCPS